MATIKKPDANPMLAMLLCIFILNLGHIVNGQTKKWIFTIIPMFIPFVGIVFWVLSILEAKATAEHLKAGEEIDENEYFNPTLFKFIKIIDSSAVCKAAA